MRYDSEGGTDGVKESGREDESRMAKCWLTEERISGREGGE